MTDELPIDAPRVKLPKPRKLWWTREIKAICDARSKLYGHSRCYEIKELSRRGPCGACQKRAAGPRRLPMKGEP